MIETQRRNARDKMLYIVALLVTGKFLVINMLFYIFMSRNTFVVRTCQSLHVISLPGLEN